MAIKSIKLENFTVFENIKCNFSRGINILIGENGTGKTHLLKAMYATTLADKYRKPFTGENTFKSEAVTVTNNYDHVILPLFFAPVEGLDINLVRNKSSDTESARVEVVTDKGTIVGHVAGLAYCTAVKPSDVEGKIFEQETLFIPAKDMLSHSGIENDYAKRLLPFDKTQINLLNDLRISRLREQTELIKTLTQKLSEILGGRVLYRNSGYYIEKRNGLVNVALEAEGFKKLAVLYRALYTGYLQPGSILFWDEPEANISRMHTADVVNMLLDLSRNGVQIFLATHDYNFMKYFSMKKKADDNVYSAY